MQRLLILTSALLFAAICYARPAVGQDQPVVQSDSQARVPPVQATPRTAQLDSAELGAQRGTEAARYESTGPWVMRGFFGGLTLGPIGAGLVWTVANNSNVAIGPQDRMLLLQEGGSEYANAYQQAYAQTLHARRKRSALTGGAIGTAALAATLTAIWAAYYYY